MRIKVNNIEGTEIEAEKVLYFCDKEYFHPKDGGTSGDMGFAFCDQSETRNDNTLKENIEGMSWWAENIVLYEGVMDECIEILHLCRGTFFDFIDAREYDYKGETVSKTAALRIAKEGFDNCCASREGDCEYIYALAICSPKVGKKYNLDEVLGMKVHYFDPSKVSKVYKKTEEHFLKMAE